MGVLTARIYLNVTNPRFFVDFQEDIQEFLDKYGDKITHLRVRYFHAFSVEGEMDFYRALSNLKHLELEEVDATKRYCAVIREDGIRVSSSRFPENFKELETLKLGLIHSSSDFDVYYQWDFFNFCEKLVYFKQALYPDHDYDPFMLGVNYDSSEDEDELLFAIVVNAIIRKRKAKFPNGPHLKYLDIENIRIDYTLSWKLPWLLDVFVKHDVKLLNVKVEILGFVGDDEPWNHPIARRGIPIMSLRNLSPNLMDVRMPNLEKLSIDGENESNLWGWGTHYPDWPALKTLDIVIEGLALQPGNMSPLFHHLFERQEPLREQLTELSLRFSTLARPICQIAYPRACSIVTVCPNLTKLTLENYPDPSPNYSCPKLWKGLKFLQELSLENCLGLGDTGFIGENVEKPAFLELKCLKKLTLKGLDKMPQITDVFLDIVLRDMKLVHFVIQSDTALHSISPQGICSLLTGQFGKSIEKFPFQGWSLSRVSDDKFQLLGSKFRSSYMI